MRTVLTLLTLRCHRLQAVPVEKADLKDIYQVGGLSGACSVLEESGRCGTCLEAGSSPFMLRACLYRSCPVTRPTPPIHPTPAVPRVFH